MWLFVLFFRQYFARDEESGEDDELDEEDDEFRPGESDGEAENDDAEDGSDDGSGSNFDDDQGKCLIATIQIHYTTAIQFGEKL